MARAIDKASHLPHIRGNNKSAVRSSGISKTSHSGRPRRSARLLERVAKIAAGSALLPQQHLRQGTTTLKKRRREESTSTSSSIKRHKQSHLAISDNPDCPTAAINHWCRAGQWPKTLFEMETLAHWLAKKRSSSLGRKRSLDGSTVSSSVSDEKTREEKSAPYKDIMYEEQLRLKGFYMDVDPVGPNRQSMDQVRILLKKKPALPTNTRFDDNRFIDTCNRMRGRNEMRVIRDIAELIVPSAESLTSEEEVKMKCLIESLDEGWNLTEPITPVRPQPDFSVGFGREAFKESHLAKIRPILGDSRTQVSRFRATEYMYFPFLSCEVKCGAAALDVADRQNAHSMGVAVRAIVGLFQLLERQHEIDREILAFSASHNDRSVRIYGYYPVIKEEITYHRHLIHEINIQTFNGKDKWTSYRFFKSIYQTWAPSHLERIRGILDELPEDISLAKASSQSTYLSQRTENSLTFGQSLELETQSVLELQRPTPETSMSLSSKATNQTSMLARESSKQKLRKNESSNSLRTA